MLVLTLLCALAWADIPPDPSYVEGCTTAQHTTSEVECRECDAWHGGREDCEKLEPEGWRTACRTAGASVWSEVMCRPRKSPPVVTDPSLIPEVGVTTGDKPDETKPETTPPVEPKPPVHVDAPPMDAGDDCATTPTQASWLLVGLSLLLARRRRRA
ncbi:MAG: hypothetical protein JRI25_15785 [Deltaproteobacteria bacterium]|nr:hypothetical protein [Deltaproteobacteria bacterium]